MQIEEEVLEPAVEAGVLPQLALVLAVVLEHHQVRHPEHGPERVAVRRAEGVRRRERVRAVPDGAEEGAAELELLADLRRADGAAALGEAAHGRGEVEFEGEYARPEVGVRGHGERGVCAAVDAEKGSEAVGRAEEGVDCGIESDLLEDLLRYAGERGHGWGAGRGRRGRRGGVGETEKRCSAHTLGEVPHQAGARGDQIVRPTFDRDLISHVALLLSLWHPRDNCNCYLSP